MFLTLSLCLFPVEDIGAEKITCLSKLYPGQLFGILRAGVEAGPPTGVLEGGLAGGQEEQEEELRHGGDRDRNWWQSAISCNLIIY